MPAYLFLNTPDWRENIYGGRGGEVLIILAMFSILFLFFYIYAKLRHIFSV